MVFERPSLTTEDAVRLAETLGLDEPRLLSSSGARFVLVGARSGAGRLWFNLDRGAWTYEALGASPGSGGTASGGTPLTEDAARAAAARWLEAAGRLPAAGYTSAVTTADGRLTVTLRPDAGPDGLPVVSDSPSLHVSFAGDGSVAEAGGEWPAEARRLTVALVSLDAALAALKQGEGELRVRGESGGFVYRPSEGVASVERVELGYQLAYGLDYTPYLAPVAVFSGSYRGARREGPFQAYVSLLAFGGGRDAGNFTLEVALPAARATAPSLTERPLAVSEAELPALGAFFDTPVGDTGQGTLSATSWDGGWLWRGVWRPAAPPGSVPVTSEGAIAAATELVGRLPVLAGTPGPPSVSYEDPGTLWIRFPLLYDGVGVARLTVDGGSEVRVQVRRSDGAVTTVICARPMALGESRPLVSPEQAWRVLRDGGGVVYREGEAMPLPVAGFAADASRVLAVTLAAVPEQPRFVRNTSYHLAYVFTGEASVGGRVIPFTAVVEAEALP